MTDPLESSTQSVPLDPQGLLAADVPCVRCGYNLRGLQPAGVCPECGTTVDRSLRGSLLAYADPQWVSRIARGMTWTVRGINGLLISLVLAIVGGILFGLVLGPVRGQTVLLAIAALVPLACSAAVLAGFWWLTTPDPGRPDDDRNQRARQMGRLGLLAALLAAVLAAPVTRYSPWPLITTHILQMAGVISLIVGCRGFFGYLSALARRIPDDDLVRRSLGIRRWLTILTALQACMQIVTALWSRAVIARGMAAGPPIGTGMGLFPVVSCISLLIGLLVLIFMDRALRLLINFRNQLRLLYEIADYNWTRAPQPDVQGQPSPTEQ